MAYFDICSSLTNMCDLISRNFSIFVPNFFFILLVNSACSTGSKYDLDLLRSDVGQCKQRVHKLKRELAKMDAEVSIRQKGKSFFSIF